MIFFEGRKVLKDSAALSVLTNTFLCPPVNVPCFAFNHPLGASDGSVEIWGNNFTSTGGLKLAISPQTPLRIAIVANTAAYITVTQTVDDGEGSVATVGATANERYISCNDVAGSVSAPAEFQSLPCSINPTGDEHILRCTNGFNIFAPDTPRYELVTFPMQNGAPSNETVNGTAPIMPCIDIALSPRWLPGPPVTAAAPQTLDNNPTASGTYDTGSGVAVGAIVVADPVTIMQLDAVSSVLSMAICVDASLDVGSSYDFSNNPLHIFIGDRIGAADRGAIATSAILIVAFSLIVVARSVLQYRTAVKLFENERREAAQQRAIVAEEKAKADILVDSDEDFLDPNHSAKEPSIHKDSAINNSSFHNNNTSFGKRPTIIQPKKPVGEASIKETRERPTFHLIEFPSILMVSVVFAARFAVRSGIRLVLFSPYQSDIILGSVALGLVVLYQLHLIYVTILSMPKNVKCYSVMVDEGSLRGRVHLTLESWFGPRVTWEVEEMMVSFAGRTIAGKNLISAEARREAATHVSSPTPIKKDSGESIQVVMGDEEAFGQSSQKNSFVHNNQHSNRSIVGSVLGAKSARNSALGPFGDEETAAIPLLGAAKKQSTMSKVSDLSVSTSTSSGSKASSSSIESVDRSSVSFIEADIWLDRYLRYVDKCRERAWYSAFQLAVIIAMKALASAESVATCEARNVVALIVMVIYTMTLAVLRPLASKGKWLVTLICNLLLTAAAALNLANSIHSDGSLTDSVVLLALMATIASTIGSIGAFMLIFWNKLHGSPVYLPIISNDANHLHATGDGSFGVPAGYRRRGEASAVLDALDAFMLPLLAVGLGSKKRSSTRGKRPTFLGISAVVEAHDTTEVPVAPPIKEGDERKRKPSNLLGSTTSSISDVSSDSEPGEEEQAERVPEFTNNSFSSYYNRNNFSTGGGVTTPAQYHSGSPKSRTLSVAQSPVKSGKLTAVGKAQHNDSFGTRPIDNDLVLEGGRSASNNHFDVEGVLTAIDNASFATNSGIGSGSPTGTRTPPSGMQMTNTSFLDDEGSSSYFHLSSRNPTNGSFSRQGTSNRSGTNLSFGYPDSTRSHNNGSSARNRSSYASASVRNSAVTIDKASRPPLASVSQRNADADIDAYIDDQDL
eukprot:GILI01009582.1.p1 GENE.GILI01009582.1~~GILI01009582.1.p1  ORF type:complete len:1236 (+),score=263.63 GILI01009582.1:312-3710(+)